MGSGLIRPMRGIVILVIGAGLVGGGLAVGVLVSTPAAESRDPSSVSSDGPGGPAALDDEEHWPPGWGPRLRPMWPATRPMPPEPEPALPGQPRPAIRGLGMTLHADDKVGSYVRAVTEMADMGCNAVLMVIPFYQDYIESSEIYAKPWHPTEATFGRLVKLAHERQMKVVVVPIVLIRYPRTSKEWRGVIQPPDWNVWFNNYRAKVFEVARWAARFQVDILAVGSELSSTEEMRDQWLQTIRKVREVYAGQLTYSSNWDRFMDVRFWDRLDYVGITAYWELNPDKDHQPTLAELMDAWRRIKPEVIEWLRDCPIPMIFTEVGYPNQNGCSYWPWNYYGSTEPDEEEQALCYESFLRAWSREPRVHGIFMYDWQDEGGPEDTGYTARGKRAETVLRRWLKGALP